MIEMISLQLWIITERDVRMTTDFVTLLNGDML
ncbi:Uncharacterised protein [Legionella sainthelensi]|nr:Uncharacterised protein [Legionella sainthelensi]